jgi:hypothetical protein
MDKYLVKVRHLNVKLLHNNIFFGSLFLTICNTGC